MRTLFVASLLPSAALAGLWVPGCFLWDYAYNRTVPDVSLPMKAPTAEVCQGFCAELPDTMCGSFTYWPGDQTCNLNVPDASLVYAEGGVSGPRSCANPALACTEFPTDAFPGDTDEETMQAWPIGYQPDKAQCWPRFYNHSFKPCPAMTVLEDTEAGWIGKCDGLIEADLPDSCEEDCVADPTCAVWQKTDDGKCYHGAGRNCLSNTNWADDRPKAAQRIMHGQIRVLKEFEGVQILGLRSMYNSENMDLLDDEEKVTACRNACASVIKCEFWQIDRISGCWIEDPEQGFTVTHPLTTASLRYNYPSAWKGEYIQHFCPNWELDLANEQARTSALISATTTSPSTTTSSTTTASSEGSSEFPVRLVVGLIAFLFLAGCATSWLVCGSPPKKARSLGRRSLGNQVVRDETPSAPGADRRPAKELAEPFAPLAQGQALREAQKQPQPGVGAPPFMVMAPPVVQARPLKQPLSLPEPILQQTPVLQPAPVQQLGLVRPIVQNVVAVPTARSPMPMYQVQRSPDLAFLRR